MLYFFPLFVVPPSCCPCCLFQCARAGARCDYSLFLGASSTNYTHLHRLASQAFALKMYLNETFSTLKLDSMETWIKVPLVGIELVSSHFWIVPPKTQSFVINMVSLPSSHSLAF